MKQQSRPVFLNLFQIKMPIMAIMSILHRASGALLVLAIPYISYLFALSLESEQGYMQVQEHLSGILVKIIMLLLGWGVLHHLLSGIRFLFLDFDIGVDKVNGRITALMATGIAATVALVSAVFILGVVQ
jgi:succinate dehydrogenase / fumarate reductase cytochrome b subunit